MDRGEKEAIVRPLRFISLQILLFGVSVCVQAYISLLLYDKKKKHA